MATIRENNGDAGADTGTQYTIALGDVFQGTLDPANDQDWIRVELTADGTIYDITLTDDNDSVAFFLYDLAGDHSISSGKYSPGVRKLILSPTTSGTYYIEVYSWDSGYSGNYELSLVENATPEGTYDEIADYMTDGYWEGRREARRAFDVGPGGVLTVNITALTEEGKQLARWALEAWANVADITFEFVEDDNAHITFDDSEKFEGGVNDSIVNNTVIVSSSIRISSDIYDVAGTTIDSNTFRVYLHELGHALGLGHPGPYDGPGGYYGDNPMVAFLNDSYQASAVSYLRQDNNTWIDASFALPVTPMIADIIAIQDLYGVPTDINAGDTVYGYQSNVDGYLGEFFKLWAGDENSSPQALEPTTLTLYDNGGNDTLDLRTDINDQRVYLRPEGISDVYGLTGNLVIARDTVIENVVAGSGNDLVVGNAVANYINGADGNDRIWGSGGDDVLEGGDGADRLEGGPGADTLDGGLGSDTASYQNSAAAVLVRLHDASAVRWGDAWGDVLTGIEHLVGSPYNDILAGDGADNILKGEGGDDVLYGGPAGGDDMMYGGNGDDRVFGGWGDDTLTGGAGNDVLKGGPGADIIIVDGDEMDVVFGGPDSDTFRFFESDLGGGTIRDFTDGEDIIDLTQFTGINSIDDLDIVSYGDNVRIRLSGTDYSTTIILSDFDMSNLDAADFIFVS